MNSRGFTKRLPSTNISARIVNLKVCLSTFAESLLIAPHLAHNQLLDISSIQKALFDLERAHLKMKHK